MNGVLLVDKPSGPTSHDVVSRVRRTLATRRVGHTGTLDPLATGLLVLVIGAATRLAQFLSSDEKAYVADVRFGFATATYDALGEALQPGPDDEPAVPVDLSALDAGLSAFRGTYLQTPPPFSAKKIAGTRAYELARAGRPPELTPVQVTVSALELLEQGADTARLRVASSSGFYVRTLAHDLGRRLGCGAHLTGLRRTRSGSFHLGDAVALAEIEAAGPAAARWLKPVDTMLPELPAVVLTDEGARRASHGSRLTATDLVSGEGGPAGPDLRVRLIGRDGTLVGIAAPDGGGGLRPVIVLGR